MARQAEKIVTHLSWRISWRGISGHVKVIITVGKTRYSKGKETVKEPCSLFSILPFYILSLSWILTPSTEKFIYVCSSFHQHISKYSTCPSFKKSENEYLHTHFTSMETGRQVKRLTQGHSKSVEERARAVQAGAWQLRTPEFQHYTPCKKQCKILIYNLAVN